jgi:hypothetical protein
MIASWRTSVDVAAEWKRFMRPATSPGLISSASAVNPRTSANRIPASVSTPRIGPVSMHALQSFGFFRDGRNPSGPTSFAPMPANGALQTLQRGSFGSAPMMRRVRRSDLCLAIVSRRSSTGSTGRG